MLPAELQPPTTEPSLGWHLWSLRAGDKIRIVEGGPIRVVTRVTTSAAYYEVIKEHTFDVFDRSLGEDKSITRKERKVEYIAARSFVEMMERGPEKAKYVQETVPEVPVVPVDKTPRAELPPIEYQKTRRKK